MEVQRYIAHKHFPVIVKWLEKRGHAIPVLHEMPQIGFVSLCEGKLISCGFLRTVEGGFALFDGLATDPDTAPELRAKANDLIIDHICNVASEMSIKHILAYSTDTNTILRAERHGFALLPHTLFVKNLNNNEKVG